MALLRPFCARCLARQPANLSQTYKALSAAAPGEHAKDGSRMLSSFSSSAFNSGRTATWNFSARPRLLASTSRPDQKLTRGPGQRRHLSSDSVMSKVTSVTEQDAAVSSLASDSWFSFVSPLSEAIQAIPGVLHLSGPYASSISLIIMTLAVRSSVSLPIAVWQRGRTARMLEKVLPEWEEAKEQLPTEIGKRMARKRATRKEYVLELHKAMKETPKALFKKYKCNPTTTFVVPLLVNIPIVFAVSMAIRYGCVPPTAWANELALFPWAGPSGEKLEQFAASARILADRGLDADQIAILAPKSGPSLIERDPTNVGPILFGMSLLLNTELGAWRRRSQDPDAWLNEAREKQEAKKADPVDQKETELPSRLEVLGKIRQSFLSNVLRLGSILFIQIGMQMPTAVLTYWITNSFFTLVQNGTLAFLDRRKDAKKALRR